VVVLDTAAVLVSSPVAVADNVVAQALMPAVELLHGAWAAADCMVSSPGLGVVQCQTMSGLSPKVAWHQESGWQGAVSNAQQGVLHSWAD
jgi:hypothetical protein